MLAILYLTAALSITQIQLGKSILTVEVANTPEAMAHGLMERTSLGEDQGMLFVYDRPKILHFWMKNTRIPLALAFFDEQRTITEIIEMAVPLQNEQLPPVYTSSLPSMYALEVPKSWFTRHQIREGTEFSFLGNANSVK